MAISKAIAMIQVVVEDEHKDLLYGVIQAALKDAEENHETGAFNLQAPQGCHSVGGQFVVNGCYLVNEPEEQDPARDVSGDPVVEKAGTE